MCALAGLCLQSGPVLEVDLLTQRRLRTFPGHTGAVTDIVLVGRGAAKCSSGPPELFSGSEDGTCRCVDLSSGKCQRMFKVKAPVRRCHVNSRDVIVACANGAIKR